MRHSWWKWGKGSISDQMCDEWIKKFSNLTDAAKVSEDNVVAHPNVRISETFIHQDKKVTKILTDYFTSANRQAFGVDVGTYIECQFTYYDGKKSGHYDWHKDSWLALSENAFDRKLSLVVLLNSPSEFEGGELQIEEESIPLEKGSVVCFPSILQHRVTPVTKGKRYTMVAWLEGARWR